MCKVVRSFWKEIEEKTAIQTASLGYLNILFGRALTQYAHAQEVSIKGVKLQTLQKRENETEGIELSSKKHLLQHFYFLYKMTPCSKLCLNVNLIQSYRRPPLLRNAFLEKTDIKFNYGELASISYNKLKEILNIVGKSDPNLDGKAH
ncbi:unnamed protein product [Rhizophagus irregularis]|nr:unnamed protein product [Rhizophagus irregularis]CAB5135508.1 unnamed protein product [Rhizophagus irregularis]CAB5393135.1 unnamed protein product [Rhizophagus irregularis]